MEKQKKAFNESEAMQEIFKRVGNLYNEFAATGKNATIKNFANFLGEKVPAMQEQIKTLEAQNEELRNYASEDLKAQREKVEELKLEVINEQNEKQKLIQQLEELQETSNSSSADSIETLQAKEQEIEELKLKASELQQLLTDAQTENQKKAAKLNAVEAEVASALKLELLPEVKALLSLVSEKLTERYGKTIPEKDIINIMFLRYNIEKWSEWFYPFVLTSEEIEENTGRTVEQWKQFFNQSKK